jgi:hypothetical protein
MKRFAAAILALVLCVYGAVLWAGSYKTSSITAQTVIDRARVDLNETTASFWSDAQLLTWVDEAVREIVYETRCLEAGSSSYVLSGTSRSFTLPGVTTVLDVEKVEHDSGVSTDVQQIFDLDRVPFSRMRLGAEKERGRPKTFAVWNYYLWIFPIPDSNQSGTTLYMYYLPTPTGCKSAASPIETPSYFDGALVDFVVAKAYLKLGEVDKAIKRLAIYEKRIQTYNATILRREPILKPPQPTTQ